jgi:hypothetical protein
MSEDKRDGYASANAVPEDRFEISSLSSETVVRADVFNVNFQATEIYSMD